MVEILLDLKQACESGHEKKAQALLPYLDNKLKIGQSSVLYCRLHPSEFTRSIKSNFKLSLAFCTFSFTTNQELFPFTTHAIELTLTTKSGLVSFCHMLLSLEQRHE